jgi:hypothetical protein
VFEYIIYLDNVVFMREFDANKDGRVSWGEFVTALSQLKTKVNGKQGNASEYSSFTKMKEDRFKHKRMAVEVQDKYKVPITFN